MAMKGPRRDDERALWTVAVVFTRSHDGLPEISGQGNFS